VLIKRFIYTSLLRVVIQYNKERIPVSTRWVGWLAAGVKHIIAVLRCRDLAVKTNSGIFFIFIDYNKEPRVEK